MMSALNLRALQIRVFPGTLQNCANNQWGTGKISEDKLKQILHMQFLQLCN